MIPVTKSFLPPRELYESYLIKVWESGWLTNGGSLVRTLETKLEDYLGVKNCIYVTNGTIALQIALKALNITKEVITTPYSYVATTNAIIWENCKPVFVDISPINFSLNPSLIETAITENTQAILATNCYGIPSDFEKLESIATKYNLKLIYDSAHAFKVEVENESILRKGDLSTLSFHATKLFHTIEGGAIICEDDELAEKIRLMRSFGHVGDNYYSLGINGKNSEFHAAMGHCLLDYMPKILEKRKEIWEYYRSELASYNRIDFNSLDKVTYNYAYYPFVATNKAQLNKIIEALNNEQIFPRKYFYPSLNSLPHYKGESCPVSESISERVICLPLYFELEFSNIINIIKIIKSAVL